MATSRHTLVLLLLGALALTEAKQLLGDKRCTWGPSFWCQDLQSSATCGATRHCIQTQWQYKSVPKDDDSICQTCLNMVKEARDQLLSNETEDDIKDVFEGSCKLVPIKLVAKECCKLVDDFVPELVDTLASQMNPQVVCSVAGLCNNARYDQLLLAYERTGSPDVQLDAAVGAALTADVDAVEASRCDDCKTVIAFARNRFDRETKDQFLNWMLRLCARMSSFSDACTNHVLTSFNDIYAFVAANFHPEPVCLSVGECYTNFHRHAGDGVDRYHAQLRRNRPQPRLPSYTIEITPLGTIGVVDVDAADPPPPPPPPNPPCELCKQLVHHLRDLLVANTTEAEFQRVLDGICGQMKQQYRGECHSLVDQYYPTIYHFLTDVLNTSEVCILAGICAPSGGQQPVVLSPLLPAATATQVRGSGDAKAAPALEITPAAAAGELLFEQQTAEQMQLPIERVVGFPTSPVYNKETCVFCQYFLHYVQQALTEPNTTSEIRHVVDEACNRLPAAINATCVQFVDSYSDAIVALLAQEIDPSRICPLLHVCPAEDPRDVEVFRQAEASAKPKCPMCLFVVTDLENRVKNEKTKESIRQHLSTMCNHLKGQVRDECNDFVQTYTNELVDMLIADLNPQEVCVYLGQCEDNRPPRTFVPDDAKLYTNEIHDDTAAGQPPTNALDAAGAGPKPKPNCALCEFVMDKLRDELRNKHNEDEIKAAVHHVCAALPRSVRRSCDDFVAKYGDAVIDMLAADIDPERVCEYLKMCGGPSPLSAVAVADSNSTQAVGGPACPLCKAVITALEAYIHFGNTTEEEVIAALDKVCEIVPPFLGGGGKCEKFVQDNAATIVKIVMIATSPGDVCAVLMICAEPPATELAQLDSVEASVSRCALCEATVQSVRMLLDNPRVDHEIDYVLSKACRAAPAESREKCRSLIAQYGEDLYRIASHVMDPHAVCRELRVCDTTPAYRPRQ